tara:strand:- start:187 stop:552 length:366 start_codon:yes stop_codon:yes gene_type:complete
MVNFPLSFISDRETPNSTIHSLEQWGSNNISDDSWKYEYRKMKHLKPYQLKILDEDATSQSQAWLLNQMWSEWLEMKKQLANSKKITSNSTNSLSDWEKAFIEWKRINTYNVSRRHNLDEF